MRLIEKNTSIPAKATQIFSTAENNQTAATVHVLQDEREEAADNNSLARFNLEGIRQATRGEPQIEVTFDIDANGILNVSAKDKITGKMQSVVIKVSFGLTDAEVEKMVKDAALHAQENRAVRELVEARNNADHLIHEARRKLDTLGDGDRTRTATEIEDAIDMLEAPIKGSDVAVLRRSSQVLAERLSILDQEKSSTENGPSAQSESDDSVVDTEFEEVSGTHRNTGS